MALKFIRSYRTGQPPRGSDVQAILTDEPARTVRDVFRRCQLLKELSARGAASADELPAILRSLVAPVFVDSALALRVAAAEAAWKVGGRHDVALPFLVWALKDEYWGVSRTAVEVLCEMGPLASDAVPDLIGLAERRIDAGPFHYEKFHEDSGEPSLLALLATAIGNCGSERSTLHASRRVLCRLCECQDVDVSAAAQVALAKLDRQLSRS